jgi:hypothetical protein
VRDFTLFSSSVTFSSAVAENVGKEVSVDKKVCVGRRNRIKSENIEKKIGI